MWGQVAIVPGDKADCIPGSSACAVSIYARAGARDEKSNTEAGTCPHRMSIAS